ncbi:unnamed protein product [Gongylonema pulchrum]|uniref:Lipoprotein n=1 Tax=Gongylonema pulchrum TaxID=637853 RepID=A0A183DV39_9BILA|nr:unnamed protein product [Gongylonema pulchrum]
MCGLSETKPSGESVPDRKSTRGCTNDSTPNRDAEQYGLIISRADENGATLTLRKDLCENSSVAGCMSQPAT